VWQTDSVQEHSDHLVAVDRSASDISQVVADLPLLKEGPQGPLTPSLVFRRGSTATQGGSNGGGGRGIARLW
jgi:hypothetical protein